MKLSKIYSNKSNFKTIEFNEGLNIILGKITQKFDKNKDTHNLGKTTLIGVIDFLLLKDISKDKKHIFTKRKIDFIDYIFFLELKLNSGKYVTVKRPIDGGKISFKLHDSAFQNYVDCESWDYEELSLKSRDEEKSAIIILNRLLDFDVLPDYSYRKTISYFLRTQADYGDVFHLKKFVGKDLDWKPFLFELLGFDSSLVKEKYELDGNYKLQSDLASNISKKFLINTTELDKINGLIEIRQLDIVELEKTINEFNFYLKEREINKDLVEVVETKIAEYNNYEYSLRYDIQQIKESLDVDVKFNLKEIEKIFSDVNIYFEKQIVKKYEDLVEFNREVTSERSRYLKESLKKKENTLKEIETELFNLNNERIKNLSFLNEKDSFVKFKKYQAELVEIEREVEHLKAQIEKIDVLKSIKDNLNVLNSNIGELSNEISNQINNGNKDYSNIRKTFNQLLTKIINKKGILSLTLNKSGNVDFNADIVGSIKEEVTAEGEGNTYKKILCVCFDLALLINYCERSFYSFVYHDGSLESLDNRKKINYLEVVNEVCENTNLQVIITLIEDDIPYIEGGGKYQFKEDQIALVLSDEEGDKGRLFEMSF